MLGEENREGYRIGLLGSGNNTIQWARTLATIGVSDAWFFSSDEDDRRIVSEITELKVEDEIPYFVDGYTDILICPGPLTPRREEVMEEALCNGVSVMCAPPLGLTTEAAEEMCVHAHHGQAALMTMLPVLYTASYQFTCQWVQGNKAIGDIEYVRITWANTEWGEDPLWDILPEPIAVFNQMGRDFVESMEVKQGPGHINISFSGDIHIDITAISGAAVPEHSIQVLGSKGAVEARPFQEEALIRLSDGQNTKSHTTGIGPRRNMLLSFVRQLEAWKENEKEPPFGEIGLEVSNLLSQIDENLARQDV